MRPETLWNMVEQHFWRVEGDTHVRNVTGTRKRFRERNVGKAAHTVIRRDELKLQLALFRCSQLQSFSIWRCSLTEMGHGKILISGANKRII